MLEAKNLEKQILLKKIDNQTLNIKIFDNKLLLAIVGEFNNNLSELEKLTNTKLFFRGNSITAKGDEDSILKVSESFKFLVNNKIPVCGHIGIRPQSIKSKKYYKKVGTNIKEYNNLIKEALLVQEAGAGLIIVECIAEEVAQKITSLLSIPVIGIGSGNKCDGQIRVIYDIFGLSFNGTPGFLKKTQKKINILENVISKYINNTKKYK